MNPLTSILRSLKRPARIWTMIIHPDPERSLGLKAFARPGLLFFQVRFLSGMDVQDYPEASAISGINSNYGLKGIRRYTQTKWVSIVDAGLKNADGQGVREVLIDVLAKFPKYDLQSEQGAEAAIQDIECRLEKVASAFEPFRQQAVEYGRKRK